MSRDKTRDAMADAIEQRDRTIYELNCAVQEVKRQRDEARTAVRDLLPWSGCLASPDTDTHKEYWRVKMAAIATTGVEEADDRRPRSHQRAAPCWARIQRWYCGACNYGGHIEYDEHEEAQALVDRLRDAHAKTGGRCRQPQISTMTESDAWCAAQKTPAAREADVVVEVSTKEAIAALRVAAADIKRLQAMVITEEESDYLCAKLDPAYVPKSLLRKLWTNVDEPDFSKATSNHDGRVDEIKINAEEVTGAVTVSPAEAVISSTHKSSELPLKLIREYIDDVARMAHGIRNHDKAFPLCPMAICADAVEFIRLINAALDAAREGK